MAISIPEVYCFLDFLILATILRFVMCKIIRKMIHFCLAYARYILSDDGFGLKRKAFNIVYLGWILEEKYEYSDTIQVPAIGRKANNGDLYDARKDTFLKASLFKSTKRPFIIKTNEIRNEPIIVDFSSTTKNPFKILGLDVGMVLNLIARFPKIQHNYRNFLTEKLEQGSAKIGLIYKVKTSAESFEVTEKTLKECIDWDSIMESKATHFVCKIEKGLSQFAVLECKDTKQGLSQTNITKATTFLQEQAQRLIDYMADIDKFSTTDRNEQELWKDKFLIRLYGDCLPFNEQNTMKLAEACEVMKQVKAMAKGRTYGNEIEFAETYTLFSIRALYRIFIRYSKSKELYHSVLFDETKLNAEEIFSDISGAYKSIEEMVDLARNSPDDFVSKKIRDTIYAYETQFNVALRGFKNNLKHCLVSLKTTLQKSKCSKEVNEIIDDFQSSFSTKDLQKFVKEQHHLIEKCKWYKTMKSKGVTFIKENEIRKINGKQAFERKVAYVFYFKDFISSYQDETWKEENAKFEEIIKEEGKKAFLYITESLCPNGTVSVQRYEWNGNSSEIQFPEGKQEYFPFKKMTKGEHFIEDEEEVSKNSVKEEIIETEPIIEEEIPQICYVKYINVPEIKLDSSTKNLVELYLTCPGSIDKSCSKERKKWLCPTCDQYLKYGFDGLVHCNCGQIRINYCLFKCDDKDHGETFQPIRQCQDIDSLLSPSKYINILLIGETGVGKTTFINSFANYLTYSSLLEAENAKLVSLVPTSFTVADENFDERKIIFGSDENEKDDPGVSKTQNCRSYVFPLKENKIRIIDTPGIGDTRGIEQDKSNMEGVMKYVLKYPKINGICFLLKPNTSRLTVAFRTAIRELLKHLHKSACRNIVFVFTNARSTFYRPGDSFPPLKTILEDISKDDEELKIELNENTYYCMDNEAFRFLILSKNGVIFDEDDMKGFHNSWKKSSNESKRMMNYLCHLQSHSTIDSVLLSTLKSFAILLSTPLAESTLKIQKRISDYILYETEKYSETEINEKISLLNREQNEIIRIRAELTSFLRHQGISSFYDEIKKHLEDIYEFEKLKSNYDEDKKDLLVRLREVQSSYEKELSKQSILFEEGNRGEMTIETVPAIAKCFYMLKFSGPEIKSAIEEAVLNLTEDWPIARDVEFDPETFKE